MSDELMSTKWTAAEAVESALAAAAVEPPIRYGLGHGGTDPDAPSPADAKGLLDCSGFACWALGLPRKVDCYWRYTDSIEADARHAGGKHDEFDQIAAPRPGCLVVYGAGPKIGHVGVVVAVPDGRWNGTPAQWSALRVAHCSVSNDRRGRAVAVTGATGFGRHGAIFAWYRDLG